MNVVIPMAGRGSRFNGPEAGGLPKPLVPIAGRPMVAWALQSIEGIRRSRLIFVALEEHSRRYELPIRLGELGGDDTVVVTVPEVTEGQACTVAAAESEMDLDEGLLIAASDTLVLSALGPDLSSLPPGCSGLISVMSLPGDHWSFARVGPEGDVVEVAEKRRISDLCSTGLYYFSSTREFCAEVKAMVGAGDRTRGEYFVIPVYQRLIEGGARIRTSRAQEVWDMGTPEAAALFEKARATGSIGTNL